MGALGRWDAAMKLVRVLAAVVSCAFASCVHTSMAPLSSPKGELVVIAVPGVKVGEPVRESDRLRIAENLLEGVDRSWWEATYGPGKVLGVGVYGRVGSSERKAGGKPFAASTSLVYLRSTLPAQQADAMLPALVNKVYRNATKHYEVIPVSQLKRQKQ